MVRTNKTIIKLYNYFNKENAVDLEETTKERLNDIYSWYMNIKDLREYSRKFGYSKNKLMSELNLSWDQIKDFESHKYKSATAVVIKAYNFFHNEDNRLPEVQINENLKNRWNKKKEEKIVEPAVAEPCVIQEAEEHQGYYSGYVAEDEHYDRIAELQKKIDYLEDKVDFYSKENARLEMQINRYEKLIDRL